MSKLSKKITNLRSNISSKLKKPPPPSPSSNSGSIISAEYHSPEELFYKSTSTQFHATQSSPAIPNVARRIHNASTLDQFSYDPYAFVVPQQTSFVISPPSTTGAASQPSPDKVIVANSNPTPSNSSSNDSSSASPTACTKSSRNSKADSGIVETLDNQSEDSVGSSPRESPPAVASPTSKAVVTSATEIPRPSIKNFTSIQHPAFRGSSVAFAPVAISGANQALTQRSSRADPIITIRRPRLRALSSDRSVARIRNQYKVARQQEKLRGELCKGGSWVLCLELIFL